MDSSVETEIANLALTKLGAARILSVDDDVKAARSIRAIWNLVRDSELRAHQWSFAIRSVLLPQLDLTPVSLRLTNAFELPNDFIRLIEVSTTDEIATGLNLFNYRAGRNNDYQIETTPDGTRAIFTALGPPLFISYIWRVEVTGLWDPSFKMAFAARLAMELCESLTQSSSKRQLAQQEYIAAIHDAVRCNAIELASEPIADDSWILSRLYS